MSFFDGFLTYLSILQIYDCFWMFGANLEGSQRPVQYKPQVGAKWCSYLELALSVKFFLIFRAFYSIKMDFFLKHQPNFSQKSQVHTSIWGTQGLHIKVGGGDLVFWSEKWHFETIIEKTI